MAVCGAAGSAAERHHRQSGATVAELPGDVREAAAVAAGSDSRSRRTSVRRTGGPAGGPKPPGSDTSTSLTEVVLYCFKRLQQFASLKYNRKVP